MIMVNSGLKGLKYNLVNLGVHRLGYWQLGYCLISHSVCEDIGLVIWDLKMAG